MREMAGLSVLLETQNQKRNATTQPLNAKKITMLSSPGASASSSKTTPFRSNASTSFLDHCFLCRQRLLPGKDIYMYKGDKGFCSVECRHRQMFMDEQESVRRDSNCSLYAMRQPSSTSSSPPPSAADRKGAKRAGRAAAAAAGGFAY